MRAVLALVVAVSLIVAPVASVAAMPCSHASAPEGAAHAGHAMAGDAVAASHATAAHEVASPDACDCDPGCASHCDGATPAAAAVPFTPIPVDVTESPTLRLTHRAHVDPPPGAPLRPPQTPIA